MFKFTLFTLLFVLGSYAQGQKVYRPNIGVTKDYPVSIKLTNGNDQKAFGGAAAAGLSDGDDEGHTLSALIEVSFWVSDELTLTAVVDSHLFTDVLTWDDNVRSGRDYAKFIHQDYNQNSNHFDNLYNQMLNRLIDDDTHLNLYSETSGIKFYLDNKNAKSVAFWRLGLGVVSENLGFLAHPVQEAWHKTNLNRDYDHVSFTNNVKWHSLMHVAAGLSKQIKLGNFATLQSEGVLSYEALDFLEAYMLTLGSKQTIMLNTHGKKKNGYNKRTLSLDLGGNILYQGEFNEFGKIGLNWVGDIMHYGVSLSSQQYPYPNTITKLNNSSETYFEGGVKIFIPSKGKKKKKRF